MSVIRKVQVRRGTASAWSSANPVLSSGEFGYDTTNGKLKIGDGSTAWNSLAFAHYKPSEVDALIADFQTSEDVQTALADVPKLDEINTFTTRQKIRGVIDAYVGENLPQAPASYTQPQKDSFIGGWQFRTNGGAFPWYDSIYPDNIVGFGWNLDGSVHNEPRMTMSFESAFRAANGAPDMFEWNLDYVMQDGSLFRQFAWAGPRDAPTQATKDTVGGAIYGNVFYLGSFDAAATSNPEILFDFRGTGDNVVWIGLDGGENTYINLRSRDKAVIRQWVGGTDYVGLPYIARVDIAGFGLENTTVFGTQAFGGVSGSQRVYMRAISTQSIVEVKSASNRISIGAFSSGVNVVDTTGTTWLRDETGGIYFQHANGVGTRLGRPNYAIGFLGGTPVFKQTVPASATDLSSVIALANAIRTGLINYNLFG